MFAVYCDSLIDPWKLPNILGQKFPGVESFSATVKFRFVPKKEGDRFGFIVLGTDYAAITIVSKSDGNYITMTKCVNADKHQLPSDSLVAKVIGGEFYFRIKVENGPEYSFQYSTDGMTYVPVPGTFIAKPGKWVSAKIGMYCSGRVWTNDSGYAEIDQFELERF